MIQGKKASYQKSKANGLGDLLPNLSPQSNLKETSDKSKWSIFYKISDLCSFKVSRVSENKERWRNYYKYTRGNEGDRICDCNVFCKLDQ